MFYPAKTCAALGNNTVVADELLAETAAPSADAHVVII